MRPRGRIHSPVTRARHSRHCFADGPARKEKGEERKEGNG